MQDVKQILFPTDFSEASEQALDHAIVFAREYGATLHMLHVTVLLGDDPRNPAYHFPETGEIYQRVHDHCNSDLAKLADRHPHESIEIVQARVRNSSAPAAILDYVADHDIDLVVMGTAGRRGLRRILLGSVAGKVVQLAPCPVMTIREVEPSRAPERIEKVLAPIDFSEPAERALKIAFEIAARHGAMLQLVHVIEDFANFPSFYRSSLPEGDIRDILGPEVEKQLQALVRELSRGRSDAPPTTVVPLQGKSSVAIVDYAESEESDLIVISTRGLTGLQRILVGSTTERVISLARCPVLAVKDPEEVLEGDVEDADDALGRDDAPAGDA